MGNFLRKREDQYLPQAASPPDTHSSQDDTVAQSGTDPLTEPPPPPPSDIRPTTAADDEKTEGEREGGGDRDAEGEGEREGGGERERGKGEKGQESEAQREVEREGGGKEREGEGERGWSSTTSGSERDTSSSPTEPLPLNRVAELRKDSESSFNVGSTESLVGVSRERINPADHKKPVKFKKIQPTIKTGDLALLYRRDQSVPHVAIFVNHLAADPLFPLLLVKAKTKPLPREKFCPHKPRFIHPITATTRIFYGDYERVAVCYMESPREIEVQEAMDAIAAVEAIPFSEREQSAIANASSDNERSLFMSTFMAAYYYKQLGVFNGVPDEVTPEDFLKELPLSEPVYIKLPSVKYGPMVQHNHFLKQLV